VLQKQSLSRQIKTHAHQLGFDLCRITPVTDAPHAGFFVQWLAQGRAGEMGYLARYVEKRRQPALLAEGEPPFRSMIVLGVDYHQFDLPASLRDDPSRGLIASYAWGDDYHEIIRPLLYELDAFIRAQTGRASQGKCLVDTGPVLERDWAQRAGLGFTGKNCCTITPGLGSWLFLAVVLVPERLDYDPPPRRLDPSSAYHKPPLQATLAGLPPGGDYGTWEIPLQAGDGATATRTGTCGSCTRCLVACPTDAFVGPFHLDPQRCISYWTIEARGAIPQALRPLFSNRIFGCDICQEVCPWNQRLSNRKPRLAGLEAHHDRVAIPLLEGFAPQTPYWLEAQAFNARFRRSPIRRAKRGGMLRNVCVALGNWAAPETVPSLALALVDPEPVARAHAAWALGRVLRRHGMEAARAALLDAQVKESHPEVRAELTCALEI
jgi:epoxyqueuosine reductase